MLSFSYSRKYDIDIKDFTTYVSLEEVKKISLVSSLITVL